jgi:hypothetical protein
MSKLILRNIDSDDIWDGKIYYAFRFIIGSNYSINLNANPVLIYKVKAIDSGNGYYRFQIVSSDKPSKNSRVLFNSASIISPYVNTWKNRYGWWVCESYEEAVETRDNLFNSAINTLQQKIKKLENQRNLIEQYESNNGV